MNGGNYWTLLGLLFSRKLVVFTVSSTKIHTMRDLSDAATCRHLVGFPDLQRKIGDLHWNCVPCLCKNILLKIVLYSYDELQYVLLYVKYENVLYVRMYRCTTRFGTHTVCRITGPITITTFPMKVREFHRVLARCSVASVTYI